MDRNKALDLIDDLIDDRLDAIRSMATLGDEEEREQASKDLAEMKELREYVTNNLS